MTPGNRLVGAAALAYLAWAIAMPGLAVAQKAGATEYVIGPNDVLDIRVFKQDELTNKYSVGSDGAFTFPRIGRITAGGLTVRLVENDIRERLAKSVLVDPLVTVVVDQYRSQQVYVMGEVRQSQTLPFTGSMNLIDALTRVGGPTDRAGVEVLISRPAATGAPPANPTTDSPTKQLNTSGLPKGDPNVIRVNLDALQKGDFSQNVALMSGDIVTVLPAETVIVQGQVARTGEYPIRPGMTVQQVIAIAGGVTDIGSDTRIEIQREVNGKKTTIKAKLDDRVRGGDIIKVPKRWL